MCGEHASFEVLPRYPSGPVLENTDSLRAYSAAQSQWAITVAGIYRDSSIKRNATANCLDAYRADGVIH
jgi:hypothetical protein